MFLLVIMGTLFVTRLEESEFLWSLCVSMSGLTMVKVYKAEIVLFQSPYSMHLFTISMLSLGPTKMEYVHVLHGLGL